MLCELSKVLRALGRDIFRDIIGISFLGARIFKIPCTRNFFLGTSMQEMFSPCNMLFLGVTEGEWFFSCSDVCMRFSVQVCLQNNFFKVTPRPAKVKWFTSQVSLDLCWQSWSFSTLSTFFFFFTINKSLPKQVDLEATGCVMSIIYVSFSSEQKIKQINVNSDFVRFTEINALHHDSKSTVE